MNVFIAGASGTIGIPLVRALVARGHQVSAMTRSPRKREVLRALGASPVVADALDRDELVEAVERAQPTHVIHQLTALPKDGPRRKRDLEPTNRLRIEGTRNLLDAAIVAGAKRFIAGSFAPFAPRGDSATGDAPAAEVCNDASLLPFIHLDDAVGATVLALDRAPAGAVYEIVCDNAVSLTDVVEALAEFTGAAKPRKVPAWLPRLLAPTMARIMSMRMPLSNAKALGWRLDYPTVRDGLAEMFEPAA